MTEIQEIPARLDRLRLLRDHLGLTAAMRDYAADVIDYYDRNRVLGWSPREAFIRAGEQARLKLPKDVTEIF